MKKNGRPRLPRNHPEPTPVVGARWVPLTQGLFALVDEADFEMLNGYAWCPLTTKGRPDNPSATTHIKGGAKMLMHRMIMAPADGLEVDHINGNRLDNRRSNLRTCTTYQNNQNVRRKRSNTSGFKGVFRRNHGHADRWSARIWANGCGRTLGVYDTPEQAHRAYVAAAAELHGEFANSGDANALV